MSAQNNLNTLNTNHCTGALPGSLPVHFESNNFSFTVPINKVDEFLNTFPEYIKEQKEEGLSDDY